MPGGSFLKQPPQGRRGKALALVEWDEENREYTGRKETISR
ncbi:hypothetical protein CLOM621_06584 [Clostridium sp. M62/1]|nr:hypothetical protein CLOM621_06584 [Clostridium sp. M62/1]